MFYKQLKEDNQLMRTVLIAIAQDTRQYIESARVLSSVAENRVTVLKADVEKLRKRVIEKDNVIDELREKLRDKHSEILTLHAKMKERWHVKLPVVAGNPVILVTVNYYTDTTVVFEQTGFLVCPDYPHIYEIDKVKWLAQVSP